MGEPLFDELTAAFVSCGIAAVVILRSAAECAEPDTAKTRGLIGHLLLGIAVSLLLYRWADAVASLPPQARPNLWLSGGLSATCGIALTAAVKGVIASSVAHRVRYFAIAVFSGAIALVLALAWAWAILLLTLLAASFALNRWFMNRSRGDNSVENDGDSNREPTLVLIVSSALLLLLLGTWRHVIENEAQRKTRSPRYSAWPRATALRNAWERTGWAAKPSDSESANRLEDVASREQRVALGLGSLLLVVVLASRRETNHEAAVSEADRAD